MSKEPSIIGGLRGYASRFLELICDPNYRTMRLIEVGLHEALQDIQKGLYAVLDTSVSPSDNEQMKKVEHISEETLTDLEKRLRYENAGENALFEYLGLDPKPI